MSYEVDCPQNSWANISDLYDRFGEEFVDKLSIRRSWNDEIQDYVADESKTNMTRVQILALEDAKALIKEKLSRCFNNISNLDKHVFGSVKQMHIKLTIETLKSGGDCRGCECVSSIDDLCQGVCDNGKCLEKKSTFISVSKAKFKCEGSCGCC